MLPPFDPATGRLPEGEHAATWDESGRARQKSQFGGELFPNVVESGSGLDFADFFKNERDGGRKGIVVLTLGRPS